MRNGYVGRMVRAIGLFGGVLLAAASCGSSGSNETVPDASVVEAGVQINLDGGGSMVASCTARSCAQQGFTCGPNGDGCGDVIQCGSCPSGQSCGAGGYSKCGTPMSSSGADGGMRCAPKACSDFPAMSCGQQGDGCGGLTANCGACPSGQYCGGGGPSLCGTGGDGSAPPGTGADAGDGGTCTPKTCAGFPAGTCGFQGDGCGGVTADCGACTLPAYCGGGGPSLCGTGPAADGSTLSMCVPRTCASLGYDCGFAGDGCGGVVGPCGSGCIAPQVCGGSQPNECGTNVPCTGLCQQQQACDGGATTTLTGIVRAGLQEGTTAWVPAGTVPDPVPGVLVYIPSTTVQPFTSDPNDPQVQCSQCGADVTGSPLVQATTDFTGHFTLTNVPVSTSTGDTIPIVIQLGRWRRQYAFPVLNACASNTLPQDLNLPSDSTEGDIPLTAISTGSYDPIECVLLKMGINQKEFTSYTTWAAETATGTAPKPGRVHVYTATTGGGGLANPGAILDPQLDETALLGTGTAGSATNGNYMMYDQILLPCWGGPATKNAAELYDLGYYGDHGGHFFATHFSYTWLAGNTNSNLNAIANWDLRADDNTNPLPNGVAFTGNVSTTVPPTVPVTNPGTFALWLNYVGALANSNPAGGGGAMPPADPQVTITAGRHDVDTVAGQSVDWIDGTDPAPKASSSSTMLLHFTFDMPVPTPDTADASSAGQCGHGIFSDFHVNSATQSNGETFPNECDTSALTSQERILEYMIWDLASCVPSPPPMSTCTPKTCADYPAGTCGQQGDGCGGLTTDCGTCPSGQTCGGCGANVCCVEEAGTCTAMTCASYPGLCGQQADGCGSLTSNCTCPPGQTCGGSGSPGVCGSPPDAGPPVCVPMTCASYSGICGQQSDGCGGLTSDCNPCTAPATCGGCGTPGQCCSPPPNTCKPMTCAELDINCGPAGNGCGGLIASCGTCTPPQTCGGGGTPGQCGNRGVH